MIRSISLHVTPTAREAQAILTHVEDELRSNDADVQRSPYGAIHFRFPAPWRARHLGSLLAVTSGRVTIGAAVGAPWRVRYELKFTLLQWLATFLSVLVVLTGFRMGHHITFWGVVGVWAVFYALPQIAATARFRSLIRARVREVIEREYRTGETEIP